MSCNQCGAPAQGRFCRHCESDGRMEEISDDLTAKFDEEDDDFETAELREDETGDESAHARRTAEQLRMAREEDDAAL